MSSAQPIHWGSIKIQTAKDAMTRLENGKRKEIQHFLFDNIDVADGLEDVKAEVEKVCKMRFNHAWRLM
jgi:hypothetical protein